MRFRFILPFYTIWHFKGGVFFGTMGAMTKTSDLEKRIIELQRQCAESVVEISKKEHNIAVLTAHINDLKFQLSRNEVVGVLARRLFQEVDKKIMRWLTRRGQKKQQIRRPRLKITLVGNESYGQLLDVAKRYDAQEFFSYKYRLSKNSLRIHYRITAKSYRVGRDGMLYVGSRIRKMISRMRSYAR